MQLREYNLNAGKAHTFHFINWNTAPIVTDRHRIVRVERNGNVVAIPLKRLIYRVVNDLPQAVHKTARIR